MVTVKTRSTSRKIRLQTSGPETVPRWDLGRSFHWDEILIVTSRVGNRTETVHYGDCGKDFSQKTRRILHKETLCIPEGLIIGPFTIIFWLYTKIRNDIPLKIVTDMKCRKTTVALKVELPTYCRCVWLVSSFRILNTLHRRSYLWSVLSGYTGEKTSFLATWVGIKATVSTLTREFTVLIYLGKLPPIIINPILILARASFCFRESREGVSQDRLLLTRLSRHTRSWELNVKYVIITSSTLLHLDIKPNHTCVDWV